MNPFPLPRSESSHVPAAPRPVRRGGAAGFTLIEMLTVVASLIIVLGLMVSLAWDVRRQSSERLTKDLLVKLDALMTRYVERYKQMPQVSAFIETAGANAAATSAGGGIAMNGPGRRAEEELPDESTLLGAAEANNREFVMALQTESAGSGPESEPFGHLAGGMYDEVTLRDAWGTPIVFMPAMHPAIGMALGNRPFFFSAGPDRTFRTLEDNLYSYEQGTGTARAGE